ncbi:MAG: M14 family metallopeptidase [Saprospiraceae bacterium]
MYRLPFFLFCLFLSQFTLAQTIPSPNEFLPRNHGDHFTPHYELVDYFEKVAEQSPNVQLQQYGSTNQDRPLIVAYISSKENLENLEAIRLNNLRKTGLVKDDKKIDKANDRAIVWLSFGVHGNEAGASEASIAALYALANPSDKRVQEWLKNTVVILDPCINPDGYSRYTHWNRNVGMETPNALPEAHEHHEPWPGGRVNHYLFDLNRDWAWQTQVESQQRIKVYNQWMPHVHVDFHEQGHNNAYYFAPAAHPYHKYITNWQSEFQTQIGINHTKYFDEQGWLYFTREIFDLFYPSYGDTWPTFNGAVGMTYEQAGHSMAGRAIIMENGDTLKLSDRIEHHMTTALSTVEVSSKNAEKLVNRFEDYFSENGQPDGKYKSFVIKGTNPSGKIAALCRLLDANGIQYGLAKKETKLSEAFHYQTGKDANISLTKKDLVINIWQPKSVLTQVLFEPEPYLEDSLTYDITAWALPYAYGLEAYALSKKVEMGKQPVFPNLSVGTSQAGNTLTKDKTKRVYAWVAPWKSMDNARFLSMLLQKGVKVRYARTAFSIEGKNYKPGTLVINIGDNRLLKGKLSEIISAAALQTDQELNVVSTGFVSTGRDFGSRGLKLIKSPKVLLLTGDGTSANGYGQVWHYFEDALDYPLTAITTDRLNADVLDDYNMLILPEGYYKIKDAKLKEIRSWVTKGGRVIAIGSALRVLNEKEGFSLKGYASDKDKSADKSAREKAKMNSRLHPYAGQERRSITGQMPGAIFKVNMDQTHPLGFGLGKHYFSLKTSSRKYQILKNTWNVGTIDKEAFHLGFAGAAAVKKIKETTVFGVQDMGRGSVVYMVDNPLFRGFWEEGKFLFSNAVFLR